MRSISDEFTTKTHKFHLKFVFVFLFQARKTNESTMHEQLHSRKATNRIHGAEKSDILMSRYTFMDQILTMW